MTSISAEFRDVAVVKKANVYFDGKCVSHTVHFADGTKKSIGVIMPAVLTFNTGVPEIMETVSGSCRYRLSGEDWKICSEGGRFNVPGNSSFDIEVNGDAYHYVCHFD